MKSFKTPLCLWILLAAAMISARAADPALKVGDPAPALQTGKWVQGEPITGFVKGKTYVVEFWATWCPPCRESIPHLNELHKKFKDRGLVVIGQDCREDDESIVRRFVKKMGEKMSYRVALDDKRGDEPGKMFESWMKASGQDGIPSAFVVNMHGVVAWIGYPMDLTDELVASILEDRFDLKKSADEFLKYAALCAVETRIRESIEKKDWQTATALLAEYGKLAKQDDVDVQRLSIMVARRDYGAALDLAGTLYRRDNSGKPSSPSAAGILNWLAWSIATDDSANADDLANAEKLADQCIALTDVNKAESYAQHLCTQARVLFRLNRIKEAVSVQEKAIRVAPADEKPEMEKTLKNYKSGKLPASK